MKVNVFGGGAMWIILVGCFLALVLPNDSLAADAAEREVIGFSKDGKWFAFEEYGIHDGSGFPYSNIYIIDTQYDKWAPGSPFRVRIDDEKVSLREARSKSRASASTALKKLDTFHPGTVLASNALGEVTSDPLTMRFRRSYNLNDLWVMRAEQVSLPAPKDCFDTNPVRGIALEYGQAGTGMREVYRDRAIPASRGCPSEYQLADILAFDEGNVSRIVVLLHVLTRGFEGMDARFLAIPLATIK